MTQDDERLDITDTPAEYPVAFEQLPILPCADMLFPIPSTAGRETPVRLIEEAISSNKLVVSLRKDASVEEPGQGDLHRAGTPTHNHKMASCRIAARPIVQGCRGCTRKRDHGAPTSGRRDVGRRRGRRPGSQGRAAANINQLPACRRSLRCCPTTSGAGRTSPAGRLADFIASSLAHVEHRRQAGSPETVDVRTRLTPESPAHHEAEVLELG